MEGTGLRLTEEVIRGAVRDYLLRKPRGNWHQELVREHGGREHGADLVMIGGKRNSERFIIECKGRSYAVSADAINKEGWLNALGQLVTRMNTERVIQSGKHKGEINRAVKYGMGLYWVGAQVALRRIPRKIANTLNLHIFSVYEDGWVRQWTPSDFGATYPDEAFAPPAEEPQDGSEATK
ncbi:MAG: hypothetical protein E7620_03550 [Ruminococcaceae bacterium]|nr:hypothetical protein [Oscillospiraceae bacterium]